MNTRYKSFVFYAIMLLLLGPAVASAQSISNYAFSTNATASLNRSDGSLIDDIDMSIGTTVLVGGSQGNFSSTSTPIGFDFFINGLRQTTFNATSNGWVGIGTNASPATGWLAGAGIKLAPFLGVNASTMGTSSIGRVHYKLIGSQPSRVLVVEFLRMAINTSVVDDTTTFQVRLYESNGAIEYVYGRMAVTTGAPVSFNVGFQFATTIYQSVNVNTHASSTSSSTLNTFSTNGYITSLNSSANGSRRSYKWIPSPPEDVQNITFSSVTSSSLGLSWTDASDEISYAVYRSTDGGLNYTFVTLLSANTTTFSQSLLTPNTTYNYRVYAIKESTSIPIDGSVTTLPPPKVITVQSGLWNDPTTWLGGALPQPGDSVEIANGHTVQINATGLSCGILQVNGVLQYSAVSIGNLTVNGNVIVGATGNFNAGSGTGTSHVLNIGGAATANNPGSLIANGTFSMNTTAKVQVVFGGSQDASISGTTVCEFANILINKGTNNTAILEAQTTFTQQAAGTGVTNRISITAGTFKISAAVNITPYANNTAATIIGVNGRLWLNHTSAVFNAPAQAGTSGITIAGELRMDLGNMSIGSGANTVTVTGTLRLNGGKLTVLGGLAALATTSNLIFNGGDLDLDPQATSNLSTVTSIVNVGANATLNWSSGTINIFDPHASAGGTSFAILAGGSKLITGGTLKLGNGILSGSGGTGSIGGYLINSLFALNNLVVDNPNITQVRISAAGLTVNNLTLHTGSYIFVGNGLIGSTLKVLNNIVNDGTISGTEPMGSQSLGELIFEGTTPQTVSGSGTFDKLPVVTVNNAAGVSFAAATASPLSIERINLISGAVTPGSGFIIGTLTKWGTIQIGGISETGTNGRFTTPPSISGYPVLIYGPANGIMTFRSYNELPVSAEYGSITIADAEGLVSNESISTETLIMNGGNLNMGAFDLTVGLDAVRGSTLTRSSGMVQFTTGSFKRWYAPGQTLNNDYNSGFPMLFGTQERSMLLQSSAALTAGGLFSVKHTTSSGVTDLAPAFTDGGITINRRADANWQLNSGAVNVSGGSISVKLVGQNIGSVTVPADLRMIRATAAATGTFLSGGGTTNKPDVSRTFTSAEIGSGALNNTFYFGSNSSVNPLSPTVISVASGAWNNPATWEGGVIPTAANNAMIASGHNVSVAATNICNSLTILSGGTLTAATGNLNLGGSLLVDGTLNASGSNINIVSVGLSGITVSSAGIFNLSSGTVSLGPSGGSNRTFLLQGTATISGGTLNINGNMNISASASFTQSAGDINIDGNSGTASSSVGQGTNMLNINTNNLNCSAGTITIIDPPHNSYPVNTTMALRITATASTTAFSGTHTVRFGDGASNETGNANGFVIDTKRNGVVPLQNVIVNGGNTGTGRWVSSSYSTGSFGTHIKGTLTVTANSEFRHTTATQLAIGTGIVNNGILTIANNMTFGGLGYVVANNATISGTGSFRNTVGTSSAAFTSVALDLGAGNSLTLSTNNVVFGFSGTLAPGANNIITGNNTVQINNGATLNITSGYIVGRLARYMAAGSNVQRSFDIGSASTYLPVFVTMPSIATGGYFTAGISDGDHPQIGSSCINTAKNINRHWTLENNVAGSSPATVVFNFATGDVDAGANLTAAKAFTYNGSSWVGGSTGSSTGITFQVNNLNQYGDIAIGEITPVLASVAISTPNTTICSGTSVTFTATPTNGGTSPTYQWKINGSNVGTGGNTFTTTTLANNDAVTCELTSNSGCVTTSVVTSNSIAMTVDAPTVGGSVSGGSTICSGSPVGTLTLSGNTGAVTRWESAAPFSTTWTSISNTTTTLNPGSITASTQYRAVIKNGTCPETNATATVVNVDAPSVGGTMSSSRSPLICTGTAPGDITVADYTGTIVRWETSVSPFTTWTTISHTNATYNPGVLTEDHQYRVVVKNGQCAEATSLVYQIFISPLSVGGTVTGGTNICSGGNSGKLTLSGHTGDILRWEYAAAPFTGWWSNTNSADTFSLAGLTETTRVRAVVQSGPCPAATATFTTVTVDPASVGGTISGTSSVCTANNPGNLTLSGQTGSITRWESSVAPFTTWNTISNTTTTTLDPGTLTETTQFRAVVQSGTCAAANSAVFTVTVSSATVAGAVTGGSNICSGSTGGTLTLSGSNGSVVNWESSVAPFTTWSTIANTTSSLNVGSLTATTQFRAVVQNGACASAASTSTTITVDAPSAGGSVAGGSTICSGSSGGSLTLSGQTGNVIKWESSVSPFTTWTTIANTTTTLNTGTISETTQFRAVVQNGTCASANSATATVSITPAAVGGTVSGGASICSGSTSPTLTLSGETGSVVRWESSVAPFTTWTNIANTTNSLDPGTLTETTQFRAVVQNGSCTPANSSVETVSVVPPSVGGTIAGGSSVCPGSPAGTLTLSGQTGSVIRWESSVSPFTSWTTISNTTNTLSPGTLSETTQFRVRVQSGSCASDNSATATVTVLPGSVGGTVSGGSTVCPGSPAGNLTLSGETGSITRWESSVAPFSSWTPIANTTNTLTPGTLTETTQFRAVVRNGTCASTLSSIETITITNGTVAGTIGGVTPVCSGTSTTLTLSGNTGSVLNWESSVSPFTSWTTIANTTTTLNTGAITVETRFRAVVQSGTCPSSTTAAYAVKTITTGAWTGLISSDWNDPGNWCGPIPTSTTDITLGNAPHRPQIPAGAVCRDLTIPMAGGFTEGTNSSLTVYGNISSISSFSYFGELTLAGASNHSLPSLSDLNNLVMNTTGALVMNGDIHVAGNLTLTSGNIQLGNNLLQIFNSSKLLGGSASSYFITNGTGRLKLGAFPANTPILVPLGKATSYMPVTLNNNGPGTTTIDVGLLDGVYTAYTGETPQSGTNISSAVVNATYIIKQAGGSPKNLNITFNWNASDELSMNRAQTIVGNYSGGVWNNISGAAGAASGSDPYSYTVNNVTAQGLFGVGDVTSPLPVKLLGFGAVKQKNNVLVSWATASEVNNSHFEIERSVDGKNFEKAGEVKGAGNSSTRINYTFTDLDAKIAFAQSKVIYYRLKQVDMNGEFTYSSKVAVSDERNNSLEIVSVTPNPFDNQASVSFISPSTEMMTVEVLDAFGKQVSQHKVQPIEGINLFDLSGTNLQSGVYFVRLTQAGETLHVKVVRQ